MGKPEVIKRSRGFTLIEVMIVVVIVGILAAVAYPSYTRHVQSSHAEEGKALMMEYVSSLEAYRAKNMFYPKSEAVGEGDKLLPAALNATKDESKYYEANYAPSDPPGSGFTITATTKGVMSGCQTMEYHSSGNKQGLNHKDTGWDDSKHC